MSEGSKRSPIKSEALWPFALLLLIVTCVWAAYWGWLVSFIPNGDDADRARASRGQFGDMFGAINALFSAMAFAVLIYTMWLQRKELRLQREELTETRIELARTASAQEKAEQALQKQVEAMASFAAAGAEQARTMRNLADATKDQVRYERELADAARKQADGMRDLASAIRDIRNKLK